MGEDVRSYMRRRSQDDKATRAADFGNWINPGARYVCEVQNAKVFKGYKSSAQAVLEFKVLEVQRLEPDSWYKEMDEFKKPRKEPNGVGSTCSSTFDLTKDFLSSLFYQAVSKITGQPVDELVAEVKGPDGKGTGAIVLEELVQMNDAAEPSAMRGLKVAFEVYEKPNSKNTQTISKIRWETMPPPEGHPLAGALKS